MRQLECDADLPTGRFAAARVGDWVLENSSSRWVVRNGAAGHAIVGLTGGNLVDAVRMSGGEQIGEDGLREYGSAVGFHVLDPSEFVAGPDRLEVRGELIPFPLVTEALPLPRPTAEVWWEYVLGADSPVLEARAHIEGSEASVADIVLVRGGHQLFIPGEDPLDLPLTTDAEQFGVLSSDPDLGPAIATEADVDRTLLYAGPIRVVLYQPIEGVVTRRLALGADHAEAGEWLDPGRDSLPNSAGLVELRDADGNMLSRCRSESCAAPEGTVELVPVWIGDGNGGPGGSGQSGEPARLRITAPSAFRATATRSDGLERFLLDEDGDGEFLLPPGDWSVHLSAGPTYTVFREDVTLVAGQDQRVDGLIREVVDTTGWSSADFHVHTEESIDSDITNAHRLRGALAEHLDYVVLTNHDFIGSVTPPEGLVLRSAVEVSTMRAGHFNTWPIDRSLDAAGAGAPDWRGLGVNALLDELPGQVQCNHPQFVDGGYAASFDIGLDPSRCDFVEVLNGFSPDETPVVLSDLHRAWAAGGRPVVTGASDTHYEDDFIGTPRTWIHAVGDADALDAALSRGHAVASGGPFVTLVLDGSASVGDTLSVSGPVIATIDLQAPDWMELGELVLIVDGEEVWTAELSAIAAEEELKHYTVDVEVSPAVYVSVVHRGAPPSYPATDAPPDVVSNPVFVD